MNMSKNLFQDSQLKNGLGYAYSDKDPESSSVKFPGILFKQENKTPSFRITHWWTKYPVKDFSPKQISDGVWQTSTQGMSVTLEEDEKYNTITLDLMAKNEFGDRIREAGGGFPHLLLEQFFDASPLIGQLKSFVFKSKIKIEKCLNLMNENDYDPSIHCAHTNAYFAIENYNRETKSYGQFLWFGIPVFDSRYEIPKGGKHMDGGDNSKEKKGTGMYIVAPDGKFFWDKNILDNAWHEINKDILPFIYQAFYDAKDNGFFKDATIDDMRFKSFNLGWEIPGSFHAAMKIRQTEGIYTFK